MVENPVCQVKKREILRVLKEHFGHKSLTYDWAENRRDMISEFIRTGTAKLIVHLKSIDISVILWRRAGDIITVGGDRFHGVRPVRPGIRKRIMGCFLQGVRRLSSR